MLLQVKFFFIYLYPTILNFSCPVHSEQLSRAHANEFKHDDSHVDIVV